MSDVSRRLFLGHGLLALGATSALGQERPPVMAKIPPDEKTIRPDALFLTWQRDPTTTITIQWVGREAAGDDPSLGYRERGKPTWRPGPVATRRPFPVVELPPPKAKPKADAPARKADVEDVAEKPVKSSGGPTGPTDLVIFRAELTGLTPGTEYEFRVGTLPGAHRFRTMPAKATRAFHFVSGGDCGVNPHALANNRVAAAQDPMFALIAGDLGYDNGVSGSTALQFLRNYAATMIDSEGRLIPLVASLGNHEVRGGYGKTLKDATFFTPFFNGLYAEKSYATLDFGDYLSLVLTDTGHCAKIGGEQTAWLDRALADRAGRPHVLVANHVPCYPSFRVAEGASGKAGTGEEQRKHWVPLFEKHQVDVVLEHHDHTFKRTRPLTGGDVDEATGIVYLGDGSWGKLRVPKAPEKRAYLAEVSASYHLTLHRLEDRERFHLALGQTGKVLSVCRTAKKPRRRNPG